jgi:hypothetical protein
MTRLIVVVILAYLLYAMVFSIPPFSISPSYGGSFVTLRVSPDFPGSGHRRDLVDLDLVIQKNKSGPPGTSTGTDEDRPTRIEG